MLERLELKTLDARFALRGERARSDRIRIVEVDDASLAVYGAWPWPRERLAELVDRLSAAGAEAIAFDVFFAEHDSRPAGAESDARFAQAIARSGRVFLACARAQESAGHPDQDGAAGQLLQPYRLSGARVIAGRGLDVAARLHELTGVTLPLPELLRGARGIGFVDVMDSGDGVFRHALPVVLRHGELYPSLALALACDSLRVRSDEVTIRLGHSLSLGGKSVVPINNDGAMLINFGGPSHHFAYESFLKVMRQTPTERAATYRGKTVFVACTATGLYDLRASPYGAVFNGVETLANAFENLLNSSALRRQKPAVALLYTLCWALVIGYFVPRMSARAYVPLGAGLIVLHNLLAYVQFVQRNVVVEMVTPTLGMGLSLAAVSAYWLITQEGRHRTLQRTLSRFVPPAVATHLAQEEALPSLAGERRVVTVLFADLRRFTAASARMAPEDLVALLNRYFQEMHQVILDFDGTLDKFVGDGVMALFNAPDEQVDHAHLAVAAALEMQRRIEVYREEWAFYGMPDLEASIGISTGEAVVGYVGSGERMQYTAIGAEVNVASRLDELAKELNVSVLISQATYDLVRDMAQCRLLGTFELHNVPEPVSAYEVLGMRGREESGCSHGTR